MPVTKRFDGWYWGSKGPFATKQKAVDVGVAAHANGFKEESMNAEKIAEFIGTLLHSATITHIMHFQVTGVGSDATHRALGDYYDEIVELVDTLTESIQGEYGIISNYPNSFGLPKADPLSYMKVLQEYVTEERVNMPQDSEIQNDIDAIKGLINKTVYRLANLK